MHIFLFLYSLSFEKKLPNFENILWKSLFKVFLKNVNSIGIHPQLSYGGFQIDSVMLAPKSCEPNWLNIMNQQLTNFLWRMDVMQLKINKLLGSNSLANHGG
jgi:hypothetical protein